MPSDSYVTDIVDELLGLDFPVETAENLCEQHQQLLDEAEQAGRRAISVAEELAELKADGETVERVTKISADMTAENTQRAEEYSPYRVIHGCDSPESALVTEDYPFGYRLRCRQRHWIEVAEKGSQKGKMRHASQTTERKWNYQYTEELKKYDPKFGNEHAPEGPVEPERMQAEMAAFNATARWNKPKTSTYYDFMFLYLDESNHVHTGAVHGYSGPSYWVGFRNRWQVNTPYCQFTKEQLETMADMELMSRKMNPNSWAEWQEEHGKVELINPELHKENP